MKHVVRRVLALALVLALTISLVDVSTFGIKAYADTTLSYDKSDFIIDSSGVLRGFTTAGAIKHNSLDTRNLTIPASWGVTSIDKFAFVVDDSDVDESTLDPNSYRGDAYLLNLVSYRLGSEGGLESPFYVEEGYNFKPRTNSAGGTLNNIFRMSPSNYNAGFYFKNYGILQTNQLRVPFTHIEIPNTVTRIDDSAFAIYRLGSNTDFTTTVVIHAGTDLALKNTTFATRYGTLDITIEHPENIAEIGTFAFYNDNKTTTVRGADFSTNTKITKLSDFAFAHAALPDFKLPQNLVEVGANALAETRQGSTGSSVVTLPTTLTTVHERAFYNSELHYDGIKNTSLVTIPDVAFAGTNIGNLTLPATVSVIGAHAFRKSTISNLKLNDTLTTIGIYAFSGLTGVSDRVDVTIPNSLSTMGAYAFSQSNVIRNLTLGEGLSTIPREAFSGAYVDSVTYIPAISGTLTIPNNVTHIDSFAFQYNAITNSPLPVGGNLRIIGSAAFLQGLSMPTSKLVIPSSVERIEGHAFFSSQMKEVEFKDDSNSSRLTFIGTMAFNSAIKNQETLILPHNLRQIQDYSSYAGNVYGTFGNTNVRNVIFSGAVDRIGTKAFYGSNVETVTFRGGVSTLYGSFERAAKLRHVDLGPSTNVVLGNSAFNGTTALTEFDFSRVSRIEYQAFASSGIQTVVLGRNITSMGTNVFENTKLNRIEFNPAITYIPQSTFASATVRDIQLGSHINTIETYAFDNATIPNIDFINPNSVVKHRGFNNATIQNATLSSAKQVVWGTSAFESSKISNLVSEIERISTALFTNAIIQNTQLRDTKVIEASAFTGASFASSIILPPTLTKIEEKAFEKTRQITDLVIPPLVDYIGEYAFAKAELKSIKFNKKPTHIGIGVFSMTDTQSNSVLTNPLADEEAWINKIELSPDFKEIPERMFQGRQGILAINLENVEVIGEKAFQHVGFPVADDNFFLGMKKLIEIKSHAFNGAMADRIRTIKLPNTLEKIATNAFSGYRGYSRVNTFRNATAVEFGENIRQIGANAFGGINIVDYSTVPDYIKSNPSQFSKMFSIDDNEKTFPQRYTLSIRGKYFPIRLKDYDGTVPQNYLDGKVVQNTDGSYSIRNGQSLGSTNTSHSVLGTWITTIRQNPYTPNWKSSLRIVKGVNSSPVYWVNNAPNDGNFRVISGLDLDVAGAQTPKVRLDFTDGSYSLYDVPLTVVRAMADDWVPNVNDLTVLRGADVDITAAVTNVPSTAKVLSKDIIITREPGLKRGKIKYEFTDKTQKVVIVNVNVTAREADKWIPNTKTGLIARTSDQTEYDLWSLVLNVPETGVTKSVITPVYYNMDRGVHTGVVRLTFDRDGSYKEVRLQVTISDQANTFIPKLKRLTTLLNQNVDLSEALTNKPAGTGFEIVENVDVTTLGLQIGKLKAIFSDLSAKILNVEVEVLNPNTEAVRFVPSTKVLKTYVGEVIDIRTGLKNLPTTASASVKIDVNVNEVGKQTGTITVLFSDNSTKDVDIEVEVFNRDFFEVDDESEIPSGYSKVTFKTGVGATFEDDTIPSRLYAAKNGKPIAYKFFPKSIAETGYLDTFTWAPLVNTVINAPTEFTVSASLDTRTKAEKFVPQIRVLLVYRNDFSTSLTECLVNKPIDMTALNVKVEASRNTLGTNEGLLELVFDDTSKLDIPVKIQVVGRVNTLADRFVPIVEELEVALGGNIDIKTGLKNEASEYQTLRIKRDVTTIQAGRVTGVLEVAFADGSTKDIDISVFVRDVASTPVVTEADRFVPSTKTLEVEVGGSVDIKTGLLNPESEYLGVRIAENISTTDIGMVNGKLEVRFNDNSTKIVLITVIVKEKTAQPPSTTAADTFVPQTQELTTTVGSSSLDIRTGLLNPDTEYDSIRILQDVSTVSAGKVIGTIEVRFADGSTRTVNIVVIVKPKQVAQTLASQYVLTTKDLEVEVGKSIDIKTAITSDTADIAITILDDVDTTFAGQKSGKLELRFTDGSIRTTTVRVRVTGSTNINVNPGGGGNNGGGGGNTNNNNTTNNQFLTDAINKLKEVMENTNNNNNSTTIIQAPKEEDKLGKAVVQGTVEIRSYIKMPANGRFMPDAKITRADLVVMFASLKDLKGVRPIKFSDIQSGEPYFKALQACVSNGIINGYADGTFRPYNPLTRAEFAKIISSLSPQGRGVNTNKFSDIVPNHWAKQHIDNAFLNGYLDGYPDGTFRPDALITRAEAVKVLNRFGNKMILHKDLLASNDIIRYSDVPEEHWAYAEITSALNNLKLEKITYSKDKTNKLYYRIAQDKKTKKK